jgi:hypothetical protein
MRHRATLGEAPERFRLGWEASGTGTQRRRRNGPNGAASRGERRRRGFHEGRGGAESSAAARGGNAYRRRKEWRWRNREGEARRWESGTSR